MQHTPRNGWEILEWEIHSLAPAGLTDAHDVKFQEFKYKKTHVKNLSIADIWFQEVSVMFEEKIENAWMSKPAWAGEKACPFWNSRRRWYHFSKRIKKKNKLMFILEMFDLLSDILHWDYVSAILPFHGKLVCQSNFLYWSGVPPHTHIPFSSNTIIPHPYNALQWK